MSTTSPSGFVRRFNAVWSRMRLVLTGQAVCWTLLLATVGISLLAALDYVFELGWTARAIGLAAVGSATVILAGVLLAGVFRTWSRPRTAVEIERCFPQLGQSVRTAVQFGGRPEEAVQAEGVATTLVAALETETDASTRPLELESIIPSRRLAIAAGALAAAVLLLLSAIAFDAEWRIAANRALLGDRPYTELTVAPGDALVDAGMDLPINLDLQGRTDRRVVLLSRPLDAEQAEWNEQELSDEQLTSSERNRSRYEVTLARIEHPLEYRVIAGPAESPVYRVDVRYPLSIQDIQVEITPPEYTGLDPKTVENGNIQAVAGTRAKFRIELDRAPAEAQVVFADRRALGPAGERLPDETIPLDIDGTVLSMELDLAVNQTYSILAAAADGTKLPENKYRIRVREDQPPQVWFEEPGEALEVHTLAEILMRVRVRDDFGLSRAGIVFAVNNEDEHTLLLEDFQAAADELKREGKVAPTTQAVLEKVLPLEYFQLTQKDSVIYYAFAEDNYPESPRRTETDLRFIDIRPFKRFYRVIDPEMSNGEGVRLASLAELIARQRFALNRTIQISKRPEGSGHPDLNTIDRLIQFEEELAVATRELAEGLEGLGFDGSDLLYQAEEAMLAAVDSLSVGKYDTAVLQEKDALRYLIEGRNKINVDLLKNPQLAEQVRQFDRTQLQKLRRPKSDEEEAAELVARLEELARRQDFVYEALGSLCNAESDSDSTQDAPAESSGESGKNGSGKQGTQGDSGEESEEQSAAADQSPEQASDEQKGPPEAGDKSQSGDDANEGNDSKAGGDSQEGDDSKEGGGQNAGKDGAGEKDESPSPSGDSDGQRPGQTGGPTREEIAELQLDIALDAHDIQRILQNLNGVSDLARERSEKAAGSADEVSSALARGATEKAADEAGQAAGLFRELAKNVQGLLARETAQQVAVARNLTDELARLQRELEAEARRSGASSMSETPDPAGGQRGKSGSRGDRSDDQTAQNDGENESGNRSSGTGEAGAEGQSGRGAAGRGSDGEARGRQLAERSNDLAETGRTIEDILKAIARSDDPGDREAVEEAEQLLAPGEIPATVERMQNLPAPLRAGRFREAELEAADLADRLEVAAQKLDGLHRRIVAPRLDALMALERRAAELQERLDRLETNQGISEWHREAAGLLGDLDDAGAGGGARDEFLEVLDDAGWTKHLIDSNWGWSLGPASYYLAPSNYRPRFHRVILELQMQIQEIVLGDMTADGDEATPPQYEHLVDRYYQVLSSDLRNDDK
jgi:hypothetical protein